ncbi:MAG: cyclopropane-fatty-acyl-phospholipid synthase [Gammaproteobacteria bacterium]|nr:cyclopropane-fatty-acyl-phospholipid synthase [Gammaproteobacteria bacterium]
MFAKLLEKHLRRGTLTLVTPDGARQAFGEGSPRATWAIRRRRTMRRILLNPEANLGETYMDGEWDVEDGDLVDLLTILRTNLESAVSGRGMTALTGGVATLFGSWNTVKASLSNVRHHYNLDEALFRAFLDRNMHYSCAYFREPAMTLEAAQAAKSEHIRKKLHLRPGARVLDIGSGWGSLAMHLAEHSDVKVTGLTLSSEQVRVASAEAERRGLSGRVEFILQDYRRHRGEYDGVVSVGMFEHVGRRNFGRFFNAVRTLLAPDGVALLHTIGHTGPPLPTNPWIARHIFPGGYIPAASEVVRAIERSDLVLSDVEVWRRHYASTLREWNRRFQASRETFRNSHGERFCRMWEFYLTVCTTAFEIGRLVVYQLQLAHRNDAVPLTRDYLYNGGIDTPATDIVADGH